MPGMFNSGDEPPKKTQKELDKEEEDKRIMEAEKAKHNLYWRLGDSKGELETDDLDADELKCLNEVSRKGYYHNRPQTDLQSAEPQRINPEETEFKKVSFNGPTRRPLVRRNPNEIAARAAEAKEARRAEKAEKKEVQRPVKTETMEEDEAPETAAPKPPVHESPMRTTIPPEMAGQSRGWWQCCKRRQD